MSINSRTKGHGYERECVKEFRKVFGDCERTQEGDSLDRAGVDLKGTGRLRVQCKRGRKYAPITKIKEITVSNGIHCLVTKGDRERSTITLYLEDFLELISDIGIVYE